MRRSADDARTIDLSAGPVEYVWLPGGVRGDTMPPLVFLHEGLGSLELWRGFPHQVCAATGRRGLVFSRHGYGRSAPISAPREPDYMHREALVVLPELLDELGVRDPLLIGHSDGASIALLYAGADQHAVSGLVLLAPHVFVEDRSIEAIEAARITYLGSDLRKRMATHHDDPDATFWGWNRIWLSPAFRSWNIESCLGSIQCPILVVQGLDDEYGTAAQVDAIEHGVKSSSRRVMLPGSRHSPHLDQPEETFAAVVDFVREREAGG
jgi:pimeloyl-ACP methyl ester carboxylesterase